jgi:NADPH2:quinone reductase
VVVETGDAVTRLRVGDEVWFCNGGLGGAPGNYAEYSLVDEAHAHRKPASLSFQQAAAAPLVLITAWEALYDRAGLREGQTVLVQGGAGGVGHVAVQLARLRGARVCATVGSEAAAERVRTLGAERVVRHDQEDFVAAVRDWTGERGVDVALDIMGGAVFQRSLAAMAHYGTLVTLLDPGPEVDWKEARNRNLRIGFELMLTPLLGGLPAARAHQGEILDQCGRWCDEGRLHIEVARTFPLHEAAAAHCAIETGHTHGKLVLVMED